MKTAVGLTAPHLVRTFN